MWHAACALLLRLRAASTIIADTGATVLWPFEALSRCAPLLLLLQLLQLQLRRPL